MFAKFVTWCGSGKGELERDIKKEGEMIDTLTTESANKEEQANQLGKDIEKLSATLATLDSDLKKAIDQRKTDAKNAQHELKDIADSIGALDDAMGMVSGSQTDVENDSGEADGYHSHGGGVVDTLKTQEDKFKKDLDERQKEEMYSKQAFMMKQMDLKNSIENTKTDIAEKTEMRMRKKEEAAADKKQLASTIETKNEDTETLKNMDTECREKQLSFDEKQKLRGEEIEAIGKALEILKSPDALGNAENQLGLVQTSLLQVGEKAAAQQDSIRHRARDLLAAAGKRLHSQRLGLLAEKVTVDPFAKVKKMIDDMITRLLEEANEDASHEGFCDTEMGKSKITRTKLTEDIDSLNTQIQNGKATIMTLTEENAELNKQIEELEKARAEATELRTEEKAKNTETIGDSQAGQRAVGAALAVLKDFYAKAGQATAFVQTQTNAAGIKMGSDEWNALANPNFDGKVDKGHKEGMQTFGEKFTGNQDAAGGVMALLDVTLSDFANVEAETKAAETEGEMTYKKFMTESKRNMAKKNKKIEMNSADKAESEEKLQEDIADVKSTQDELIAAQKYHEKLVPQCIDQGVTFEDRTAAREEEIKSLKEALEIFNSDDIA